jgi:hypothetical protein
VNANAAVITTSVTAATFLTTSDIRLKNNIQELSLRDGLYHLKPLTYSLNRDTSDTPRIGVSAQQVRDVYPELVGENDNGDLAVDYMALTAVLLGAVVDLKQRLDTVVA